MVVLSPENQQKLASALAEHLREGDVIALVGPLGAGKTTFVQGLATGLGITSAVTSPTFALLQQYGGGRLELYHADFYRMERPSECAELGLEEWIEGPAVLVVEWADRFPGALPKEPLWIEIGLEGEGRRLRAWGESERTRRLAQILLNTKLD